MATKPAAQKQHTEEIKYLENQIFSLREEIRKYQDNENASLLSVEDANRRAKEAEQKVAAALSKADAMEKMAKAQGAAADEATAALAEARAAAYSAREATSVMKNRRDALAEENAVLKARVQGLETERARLISDAEAVKGKLSALDALFNEYRK